MNMLVTSIKQPVKVNLPPASQVKTVPASWAGNASRVRPAAASHRHGLRGSAAG